MTAHNPGHAPHRLGRQASGILMFLRAAAASKRVLLINIASPVEMHDFFEASLIDWTVGSLVLPAPVSPWKSGTGDDREALMKSNASLQLATKMLVVQG